MNQQTGNPFGISHLAIIMDGNGRWARARGFPRLRGHEAGAERVREVVKACRKIGIDYLTLYSFSTENWKRPAEEVRGLMSLLARYLLEEKKVLMENNIQLKVIGQAQRLPAFVRSRLDDICKLTDRPGTRMTLNLALSYGGRSEIVEAVRSIARDVQNGRMEPSKIQEQTIASRLGTRGQPDPELVIRTSGEMRLSNFLLWQIAYSELYVTRTLWPDFGTPQLMEALEAFKSRDRRFGSLGT